MPVNTPIIDEDEFINRKVDEFGAAFDTPKRSWSWYDPIAEGFASLIHRFDSSKMETERLQSLVGISDEQFGDAIASGRVKGEERLLGRLPKEQRDAYIQAEIDRQKSYQDTIDKAAGYFTPAPHAEPEGVLENIAYHGLKAVPSVLAGVGEYAALGPAGMGLTETYTGNQRAREEVYSNLRKQGKSIDEATAAANSIGGNLADIGVRGVTNFATMYALGKGVDMNSTLSPFAQTARNIGAASLYSGTGAAGEQALTNYRSGIDNDVDDLLKTGLIAGGTTAALGTVSALGQLRRLWNMQKQYNQNRPIDVKFLDNPPDDPRMLGPGNEPTPPDNMPPSTNGKALALPDPNNRWNEVTGRYGFEPDTPPEGIANAIQYGQLSEQDARTMLGELGLSPQATQGMIDVAREARINDLKANTPLQINRIDKSQVGTNRIDIPRPKVSVLDAMETPELIVGPEVNSMPLDNPLLQPPVTSRNMMDAIHTPPMSPALLNRTSQQTGQTGTGNAQIPNPNTTQTENTQGINSEEQKVEEELQGLNGLMPYIPVDSELAPVNQSPQLPVDTQQRKPAMSIDELREKLFDEMMAPDEPFILEDDEIQEQFEPNMPALGQTQTPPMLPMPQEPQAQTQAPQIRQPDNLSTDDILRSGNVPPALRQILNAMGITPQEHGYNVQTNNGLSQPQINTQGGLTTPEINTKGGAVLMNEPQISGLDTDNPLLQPPDYGKAGVTPAIKDYQDKIITSFNIDHMGDRHNVDITTGEYSNDMRRKEFGSSYISILNDEGQIVARYLPYNDLFAIAPEFKKTGWVRNIEETFRKNLPNILRNAGLLDSNGQLKPDGNEEYRINKYGYNPAWQPEEDEQTENIPQLMPVPDEEKKPRPAKTAKPVQQTESVPQVTPAPEEEKPKPQPKKETGGKIQRAFAATAGGKRYRVMAEDEEGMSDVVELIGNGFATKDTGYIYDSKNRKLFKPNINRPGLRTYTDDLNEHEKQLEAEINATRDKYKSWIEGSSEDNAGENIPQVTPTPEEEKPEPKPKTPAQDKKKTLNVSANGKRYKVIPSEDNNGEYAVIEARGTGWVDKGYAFKDGKLYKTTFGPNRTYNDNLDEQEKTLEQAVRSALGLTEAITPTPEQETKPENKGEFDITPYQKIAEQVKERVIDGLGITNNELLDMAAEAFGGTKGEGKFSPKDAYDALEMGLNLAIQEMRYKPTDLRKDFFSDMETFEKSIQPKLPTQTNRTEEQNEFQQFSTPPSIAYLVNWLANIRQGNIVLEPSAGMGGLAVFAKNAGAELILNELSDRRFALLKSMNFGTVFQENAEHIGNILTQRGYNTPDKRPSRVIMNPPFSSTAGRLQGSRDSRYAVKHLEAALSFLNTNGRLVAVLGKDRFKNEPTSVISKWIKHVKKKYNVRAVVTLDGSNYYKFGTTTGNTIIVIDKTTPTPDNGTYTGHFEHIEDMYEPLKAIRDDLQGVEAPAQNKAPEVKPVESSPKVKSNNPVKSMANEIIRMVGADPDRGYYKIAELRKSLRELGIDKNTFDTAFSELWDKGFIIPVGEDSSNTEDNFIPEGLGRSFDLFKVPDLDGLRKLIQTRQGTSKTDTPAEKPIKDIDSSDGFAWHGGPNIVRGNFNLIYMGTGEGHQAFAYGLYFAEEEAVGRTYKRGRTPALVNIVLKDGTIIDDKNELFGLIFRGVTDNKLIPNDYSEKDFEQARNSLRQSVEKAMERFEDSPKFADTYKKYQSALEVLNNAKSFTVFNGNLYKVKMPSRDLLINYDADINEQPDKVRSAVQKIRNRASKWGISNEAIEELRRAPTGGAFYVALKKAMAELMRIREKSGKHQKKITRSDMAASFMLNRYGIPGLVFWDRESRGKQEGTKNFVIWNAKSIKKVAISPDSEQDAIDAFNQEKGAGSKIKKKPNATETAPKWEDPLKVGRKPTQAKPKVNTEKQIQDNIKQKILNCNTPQYTDKEAEAIAHLFVSVMKYFAGHNKFDSVSSVADEWNVTIADKEKLRSEFNVKETNKLVGGLSFVTANRRAVIGLFNDAKKSHLLHEIAHIYLKQLLKLLRDMNYNDYEGIREDWYTITNSLGFEDLYETPHKRDFNMGQLEESFARAFEKFLFSIPDSLSPASSAQVMSTIKKCVRDSYNSEEDIDKEADYQYFTERLSEGFHTDENEITEDEYSEYSKVNTEGINNFFYKLLGLNVKESAQQTQPANSTPRKPKTSTDNETQTQTASETEAGSKSGLNFDLKSEKEKDEEKKADEQNEVKNTDTLDIQELNINSAYSSGIKGFKPHPGKLVESTAMSSVSLPPASYIPNLPPRIQKEGLLSDAQIEPVIYAGMAFRRMNQNGTRRGYYIGDGTGVGKGREISGIIMDQLRQGAGKGKAVWISDKHSLISDAKRDWAGIGNNPDDIFAQENITQAKLGKQKEGIIFTAYSYMQNKARIEQLKKWLGEDFDGVIVLDECHNVNNVLKSKSSTGRTKQPSTRAVNTREFIAAFPKARVLYVSATGATEVKNLAMLDRLGLWGDNSTFKTAEDFVAAIEKGGTGAMELVARDLKAMGLFNSRSLSMDGVTFKTLEHKLTEHQKEQYDVFCQVWGTILRHLEVVIETTGQKKYIAEAQFWATLQTFFNQIIIAFQTPAAIKDMQKQLEAGNSVLIQLTNTYASAQDRAKGNATKNMAKNNDSNDDEEDFSYEELDLSPKATILKYLNSANGFPIYIMEEYTDEEGNVKTRIATDSEGNPIIDATAQASRDELVKIVESINIMPESPIDMIINYFGPENVAEITGRQERFQKGSNKPVKRSDTIRQSEINDFNNGRRRILIFSEKGGTGASYHASNDYKNRQKRIHYLLQPGWRADKAIQGLGRSHRSNEANQPEYVLVTTDIPGQKRFLSTIARRLEQLGALSSGERRKQTEGVFSEDDNLETDYVKYAIEDFFTYLDRGMYHDLPGALVVVDKLGLNPDMYTPGSKVSFPKVTKFLNRMLAVPLDLQKKIFAHFLDCIKQRKASFEARGLLDKRPEDIRAKKISVIQEKTISANTEYGSQTKYVELELEFNMYPRKFDNVMATRGNGNNECYITDRGDVVIAVPAFTGQIDIESSDVEQVYTLYYVNPRQPTNQVVRHLLDNKGVRQIVHYTKLSESDARYLWNKQAEELPKTRKERQHMITGTLLPVLRKIQQILGTSTIRIQRARTQDGKSYLGMLIPDEKLNTILFQLGVNAKREKYTPEKLLSILEKDGNIAKLEDNLRLKYSYVNGEKRLELLGVDMLMGRRLQQKGVILEIIRSKNRYFIPKGNNSILADILESWPVFDFEMIGQETDAYNPKNLYAVHPFFRPDPEDNPNINSTRYAFSDKETERRYQKSKKIDKPKLWHKISQAVNKLVKGFSDLPELSGDDSLIKAQELLRKLKRERKADVQETVQRLRAVLNGLNPDDFDLFSRAMALLDLKETRELDPEALLPWGYTPESLEYDYKQIMKDVDDNPRVADAIEKAEFLNGNIDEELADAA